MAPPKPPTQLRRVVLLAIAAIGVCALWPEPPVPIVESAPAPVAPVEISAPVVTESAPAAAPTPAFAARVLARRVETPPLPPVFATFPIVVEERHPDAVPSQTERRRIVRAPFKYPWLRIRAVIREGRVIAEEAVVADQLLVTLQPGVSPVAFAAALATGGISVREKLPGSDTLLLQLPDHDLDSVDRARARLGIRGDLFRHVDPNGIGFGAAPNDPRFVNQSQWALLNTGQSGGVAGADVNAVGLWGIVASAPKVLVAVLDSGMNFGHADLSGIAWTNPGEIASNGIDDDENGLIDDVNGWDFVTEDNNPADDQNHGSHVTGIIAARRNNHIGIAGIADPALILPVKILNASNYGATSDLIAALDYARLLGSRVMNLSLQLYPNDGALQEALNRAEAAGIVICAAAGNQGANNNTTANYPSCFPNSNIIAVGNHDRTDVRWAGSSASNFGADTVDLFAPGRDVVSTVLGDGINNGYLAMTGTSMSCPHVTAVAAIIRALNPAWTPADVKNCIMDTVTTRTAYTGICVTGGRLNAQAAIRRAIQLVPDGDPDGDSTTSLVEYALGLDPLQGNAWNGPAFHINGATLELTYPHIRTDVSYSVEASDDFVTWDAGIVNQGGSGSPVTATVPAGAVGQRFLRLKVGPLP